MDSGYARPSENLTFRCKVSRINHGYSCLANGVMNRYRDGKSACEEIDEGCLASMKIYYPSRMCSTMVTSSPGLFGEVKGPTSRCLKHSKTALRYTDNQRSTRNTARRDGAGCYMLQCVTADGEQELQV